MTLIHIGYICQLNILEGGQNTYSVHLVRVKFRNFKIAFYRELRKKF